MVRDTIAIFEGLELSAEQVRSAICAHASADTIWEWRTDADDMAENDTLREDAGVTFHAGVTGVTDGTEHAFITRGASGRAALEDLLWDVVLEAMLAEDAPAARGVPQPARRA